jgi:hypothetical protein
MQASSQCVWDVNQTPTACLSARLLLEISCMLWMALAQRGRGIKRDCLYVAILRYSTQTYNNNLSFASSLTPLLGPEMRVYAGLQKKSHSICRSGRTSNPGPFEQHFAVSPSQPNTTTSRRVIFSFKKHISPFFMSDETNARAKCMHGERKYSKHPHKFER